MGVDIRTFNILSLCSGSGGLELGLRLAVPQSGTVCYVEREAFNCALMVARMREGILDQAPIWSDLKTFDPKPWRGKVHCVTAGYPCQAISTAGHKLGKRDPRWLWPWVKDVIDTVAPVFVFCENVERHLQEGFKEVAGDLCDMGYGVEAGVFSAREIGAPHKRRRLFILGYAASGGAPADTEERGQGEDREPCRILGNGHVPKRTVAEGLPLFPPGRKALKKWSAIVGKRVSLEPVVPGMAHELAPELDGFKEGCEGRVFAMGNGVVPACAGYAFLVLLARILGRAVRE